MGEFLSGNDSGRVLGYRVQSSPGWDGEESGILQRFTNDSQGDLGAHPRFEIKADNGRLLGPSRPDNRFLSVFETVRGLEFPRIEDLPVITVSLTYLPELSS